jgi:hypothetical protein
LRVDGDGLFSDDGEAPSLMPLTWKTFSALSMYVLELLDSGTNAMPQQTVGLKKARQHSSIGSRVE